MLQIAQTSSGTQKSTYPFGNESYFFGNKRSDGESGHILVPKRGVGATIPPLGVTFN